MEEIATQAADARRQVAAQQRTRFVCHAGEFVQVRLDVQVGVLVAG